MSITVKTNAMRLLDKEKVRYVFHDNTLCESTVGVDVADFMKVDREKVFKTLVTIGKSKENYAFMIPVAKELDLKKAAKTVSEKSIEMIKSKELLSLTGYVHGGCSPIGMKKKFKTIIDISAKKQDIIYFSGGKIGYQLEMKFFDFEKIMDLIIDDICI